MSFLNIGQKLDKVMGKEQELLDAARTGNVQTVDKLLSSKVRKSVGGGVLSHRLTSILHSSVSVNCTDKNGFTPLHHATLNGHREVVERLLRGDAEPGLTDHQGCTPCHLAAWYGDEKICLQLLNAGTENIGETPSEITPVQVNQQNLTGDTALHSAAQYGHVAVVKVLLEKHANPNIRNLQEESPLDLASQYGKKEVVELLLTQFPDLVQRPLCNHSPLHLASRNGHKEVVQVLLDAGFFINTVTEMGTALHEAALCGKLDVVKLLLERGINVDEKDYKGKTALDLVDSHKAKQKSYTEIKNAIIEHMEQLQRANFDAGDYDSLSNMAQVPQPSEKQSEKTPEKRPTPKPRPRTNVIESPTAESPKDSFGYSIAVKEKTEDIDRVTSTTSSISEAASPPPLPPRMSVFPPDENIPVIAQTPEPPVIAASSTESKPDPPTARPTPMQRPKKPPRQKKSPAPARRTSDVESEPASPNLSAQSPESPPPLLPPKPDSTKIPPRPASVRKPEVIPSAIPDNKDENKATHVADSSVVMDQSCSNETGIDQSLSLSEKSKMDQSNTSSSVVDQPKGTLEAVQSIAHQTEADQSNRGSLGFQLSLTQELPPLPCGPGMDQSVETIDPVFGTPVKQNIYMEMQPAKNKQPEKESSDLNSDNVNVDNYDILFPKFKNAKGTSLKQSPKTKRPEYRRTNTAPDENVYVGPSSPPSTLAKFQEKQGLLRRANTSPDENMYITVTHKILTRQEKVEIENEYSEISEKKSPQSPQSPSEHLYAVIPEKTNSAIYEKIADASSGMKGNNSNLSSEKENSGALNNAKKEDQEAEHIPAGSKPNYLEFVARKSLSQEPLTPTGYTQPPTPDFPPPSPATALQGIEMKIQEMEVKRKSRDITTLTDETVDNIENQSVSNSFETVDSEQTSDTMKKTPPPPLKPKPKPVRNVKIDPSTVETKNSTVNTEAFQGGTEQSTERAEVFQIIEEESDTVKKITKTPDSSIDKSLSSSFEKLGTEKSSKTVIESTERIAGNQKTSKQDTDQSEQKDAAQSGSPVQMRKKSNLSSPQELDHFKDLLKGSNPEGLRKVVSQFVYDNDTSKPGRRKPVKSTYVTFDPAVEMMEKDEDIDTDQVMKSIEIDLAKRASGNADSLNFDDAGVWDEIAEIVSSFGGNLAVAPPASAGHEEKAVETGTVSLPVQKTGKGETQSIEEWLEMLELDQYENNFRVNGFDNINFLGPQIMEEQDLEQIGILDHSHRQKILEEAKFLPQITPIDPKNPPSSVKEWLTLLRLEAYLENFQSHGYETMEQVQSILWDLQLRTVLAISMLGHRKRILASLGERQPDKQNGSVKKKSFSTLKPDEVPSPYKDIDLFKDYTNVKSTKSTEDIRDPTQMTVDGGDDDVFKKDAKGKSIRNSNIHLRPPHIAQTQSPAKKWRHTPDTLIKGCCNYTSEYLGSTIVEELTGVESTRAGITKLKKSTDKLAKIPVIMLSISYKGVKFIDARSKKVICDHEIGNIFCACQDTDDLRFFAYITRDIDTGKHYCHVFKVKSSSLAHDIILTLGESFEVAYQMALKEKSVEEAMELDRLKSQSDTEDLYSKIGPKVDSNTV